MNSDEAEQALEIAREAAAALGLEPLTPEQEARFLELLTDPALILEANSRVSPPRQVG